MVEYWLKLVLLLSLILIQDSSGSRCTFPQVWEGEYFHLGYSGSLIVSNYSISEKGECVWSSGDLYVLKGEEGGKDCWRCLSIHMKHQNVLQYKESYCETRSHFGMFAELCSGIPGDGVMSSLFRRNAKPDRCPLKGPFTFSYAKGGTGPSCSSPRSYMDSCRNHSTLQMHFQACTDLKWSESTSQQLRCIGSWSEGSNSYMVGELVNGYTHSEERRYRCFVFEKPSRTTVKMAEGESATCMGLWSTQEGYKVFDMERVVGSEDKCVFPPWFSAHHTWVALDHARTIHVNSGHRSFKLKTHQDSLGPEESHYTCQDTLKQGRDTVKIVHYVQSECDSGWVCAIVSRVAERVVSLQFGNKAHNPKDACTEDYFPNPVAQLFIARAASPGPCALNGRYSLETTSRTDPLYPLTRCRQPAFSVLSAGCGSSGLKVDTRCRGDNSSTHTEFRCEAHWTEPGLSHLILSEAGSGRFLCFSYTEGMGRVSVSTCSNQPLQLVFRETGPCLQALSASLSGARRTEPNLLGISSIFILIFISYQSILLCI